MKKRYQGTRFIPSWTMICTAMLFSCTVSYGGDHFSLRSTGSSARGQEVYCYPVAQGLLQCITSTSQANKNLIVKAGNLVFHEDYPLRYMSEGVINQRSVLPVEQIGQLVGEKRQTVSSPMILYICAGMLKRVIHGNKLTPDRIHLVRMAIWDSAIV